MKNGLNDFNIKARQGCAVFHGGTFTAVFKITSFDALYCMDKKMTFCIATILCTRVCMVWRNHPDLSAGN